MPLTLNDAVMSALEAVPGTNNEKQMVFLRALLGGQNPPDDATLDDLWALVVDLINPSATGTLQEKKCAIMRSELGDPEGTYNEIEKDWWESQIPP